MKSKKIIINSGKCMGIEVDSLLTKEKNNQCCTNNIGKHFIITQNAITLIALIITIIILLILAGVTINLTLGEKGLFNIAKQGGKNYVNAGNKEIEDVQNVTNDILNNVFSNKGTVWEELKKDGSTIKDIVNSKEKLDIVLSNNEAIEEMLVSTEIRKEVLNSQTAIKTISENKVVMDKIINNNKWTEEIINNQDTIEYLKQSNNYSKNPILTGNSVNVIKSSCYGSEDIWGAWKSFDGKVDIGANGFHWSSNGTIDQYIGYIFNEPIWLFEVTINNGVQDTINNGAKTVQVQYSDNGEDYVPISNQIELEKVNSKQVIKLNSYTGKHSHWRIFIKDGYNTDFISISEIEFSGIK